MKIEQGLFKQDFTDYHAILGVSLDADAKQIRKRYLKIARKLHPDSLASATDAEKQQASELLSKMVNPAYEKLTQEKDMAEYKVVLRMRGQQLSQQATRLDMQTEAAKALLKANNSLNLYNSDLKKLADQQYESLDDVLDVTGQISELNLAYLISSAGSTPVTAPPTSTSAAGSTTATATDAASTNETEAPPPPSPRQHRESIIGSYLNRASEFEQKKAYSRAILELREAVKAHPNNAPCHSKLASLYLKAGQPTMARIHLKRALDIDPEDSLAKQLEPKINKANQGKTGKGGQRGSQSKSRGGLFGLFGGKQK
ncbi:MAG: DnaJ domain-containing protein [Leptolyngbya sp. SIO1E4]|nr:DnaJ domain-containing protein [Leptolyngbya sp. SIO1E4]